MAVVAIIPARYGSRRLPGKPLAEIAGKPMIQHVYESTTRAKGLNRVLVATDDERIRRVVQSFGGDVIMTSTRHTSGTDRLAEVAREIKAEWVVNVQGDLPFVQAQTITRTIRPLRRWPSICMGTVSTPIYDEEEWRNPNVVKVVKDAQGFALYFSRAAIPYHRSDGPESLSGREHARTAWGSRHIGIYVYRREFLLKFARLRPTRLEKLERLEQLRALEHGYRIFVTDLDEPAIEVDTPEDLARAQQYYDEEKRGLGDKKRRAFRAATPGGRTHY